jgi:hypothetical protein
LVQPSWPGNDDSNEGNRESNDNERLW